MPPRKITNLNILYASREHGLKTLRTLCVGWYYSVQIVSNWVGIPVQVYHSVQLVVTTPDALGRAESAASDAGGGECSGREWFSN